MPITLAQVAEARTNLAGVALRTPLVRCFADSPAEVWLKLENLQPIGSFKIRGAANVMARTPRQLLERGVLTASAGNMAQGVAFCARRIGVPATIVAPDTAPATKIRAVERLGGRVILAPFADWWRTFETRTYPGVEATFIHAFDDLDVMAGNGTIALELLEDLPELDAVVIPWGGGGLSCGIAAVLRQLAPRVKIYAAEVETAAPLSASLAAGEPRTVDYTPVVRRRHRQQDGLSQYVRTRAAPARWIHRRHAGRSCARHEVRGGAQPRDRGRRVGLRHCGGPLRSRRRRQGSGDRLRRQYRFGEVRATHRVLRAYGVVMKLPLVVCLAALAAALVGRAQAPAPIRVEVSLVNVGFSVRDDKGNLVTNLTQDDFEITEDGVPQKISFFARSTDVPLTLGLIMDVSGSQQSFVKPHHNDLQAFLKTVLQPAGPRLSGLLRQ